MLRFFRYYDFVLAFYLLFLSFLHHQRALLCQIHIHAAHKTFIFCRSQLILYPQSENGIPDLCVVNINLGRFILFDKSEKRRHRTRQQSGQDLSFAATVFPFCNIECNVRNWFRSILNASNKPKKHYILLSIHSR